MGNPLRADLRPLTSKLASLWPVAVALWPAGCTKDLDLIQDPPRAVARTTTGPWASMVYLARTDSGLVAIDLGWTGAERVIEESARDLGGTPADVRWVFLTHAHRDHIAGWPLVRQARFVLGAPEVPGFVGDTGYLGWATRMSDGLNEYPHPSRDSIAMVAVGGDTAIVLGRDTVYAFPIPGHTAGSMAYLFRGILFGGDAFNWRPGSGFQGARPEFSDSVAQSRESLRRLWERLPAARVRVMCTSHGKCAVADSALRAWLLR